MSAATPSRGCRTGHDHAAPGRDDRTATRPRPPQAGGDRLRASRGARRIARAGGMSENTGQDDAPDPAADGGPRRRKLSALLVEIAEDPARERISIADMLELMKARAFGAMLLIFAAPNIVPNIPGTSALLAIPLLYLTAQMMLGRPPQLPRFVAERSISRADFGRLMIRTAPYLARAERLLVPRLHVMTGPAVQRWVGGLCLVLSIVLILPVPLGNMLPGLAISVIALGILERDGLWVLIGIVISLLSLVIVSGVIWALIKAVAFLLANVFA